MAVLALCFVPTLGLLYVSFLEAFRNGALDTIMLEAGMLIPCLLTVIMGCMVVPTVFYFSRDTQILLPIAAETRLHCPGENRHGALGSAAAGNAVCPAGVCSLLDRARTFSGSWSPC